jgi:hypothetical protein
MLSLPSLGELDQGLRVRVFLCTSPTDMRKGFGTPGQAWRFQRVRFPPWQGVEPLHQESSLGLMEVTT